MKAFTNISQSKKLAEILPLESADMYFHNRSDIPNNYPLPIEWKHNNPLLSQEIPCWSLAALLSVIPKSLIYTPSPILKGYCCKNIENDIETYGDDSVDAAFEMILLLHEQKLL